MPFLALTTKNKNLLDNCVCVWCNSNSRNARKGNVFSLVLYFNEITCNVCDKQCSLVFFFPLDRFLPKVALSLPRHKMRNRAPKTLQQQDTNKNHHHRAPEGSSDDDADDHHKDDGIDQQTSDPLAIPSLRHYPFMPSKLRQLLSDPLLEVSGRIFKDVIIRLPMIDAGEEDILALASHFGQVEYVSNALNGNTRNAAKMARSFGPSKTEGEGEGDSANGVSSSSLQMSATPEEGDKYCHYVRFEDGADAIRCVLQLNGTVIDPALHRRTMDHLLHMVEQQQGAEAENALVHPGGNESDEADLWKDLKDAVHASREARYSLRCADPQASVIVVTCDFFRNAFREGAGLHEARVGLLYPTRPKSSSRSGAITSPNIRTLFMQQWGKLTGTAKIASPNSKTVASPTTAASPSTKSSPASPLKKHQYALYASGIMLEHWYHAAGFAEVQRRHREEEQDGGDDTTQTRHAATTTLPLPTASFEEMMFITNYFTFFFHHDAEHLSPSPAASGAAAGAEKEGLAEFQPIAETQKLFIHPTFWGLAPIAVAHKTLKCVDNDVEGALAWLDTAAGEEELWSGYRRSLATAAGSSSNRRTRGKASKDKEKVAGRLIDQFVDLSAAAKVAAVVLAIFSTMVVTYVVLQR
ncbi:transmembrane protein, putative [Bodo saltans]|uniref:Transmembrane protein, putative n=1 Tax=Bodo saltans TaxID=75058 RepID=A0A0S4IRG1_BODSA|nr:transmembrane protein, putative [Bodo saltans]|eukprot:CUE73780.1 transmembrane protein, putative [Bodo saltans]